MSRGFLRIAGVATLAALAGCESTQVAPVTGADTVLAADEVRLWHRAADEAEVLNRSGLLLPDPAIEAYLNGLLARLYPGTLPQGGHWQAHVLTDPTLNAFALPDGHVYLHTGLLARLDNEAQLATVLAHELTHATHRHALRNYRHLRNQSSLLVTVAVGTSGVGGLLGLLGANASVAGYSQDLEREADREGFRLLVAAGYDARESAKVFQTLIDETRRSKIKQPYFFGSHPRLAERRDTFAALAAAQPPPAGARVLAAEYATTVTAIFRPNAVAALQAGDHDAALASLRRALAARPDDPEAALVEADVYRRRWADGDAARALEIYRRLAAMAPAPAAALRGLGLVLFKQGDKPAAAAALRRYLELAPAAEDRAHIENYLLLCAHAPSPSS